jgi:hypothetical protein
MNFKLRTLLTVLMMSTSPVFAADPTPHETDDKIYIVVQELKAHAKEVAMDKKVVDQATAMRNLDLGPLFAMSVLTIAGVDCCPPIEKLSDTVWRCCDGTKTIVTTNTTVGKMLTITRQLTRHDWERFKEEKGIMAGDRKILDKLLEMRPQA